jgi:hypothetical protein
MDEDRLESAARSAGYGLKPVSLPAAPRSYSIARLAGPEDGENLKKAVVALGGVGEVKVIDSATGPQLAVQGGTAGPSRVVAAAAAAGYELKAADLPGQILLLPESERNTPAAFDERVNEDVTKVGDLAPDFSLTTKDGKSKIALSSFRDKRPVVLIFGSYT